MDSKLRKFVTLTIMSGIILSGSSYMRIVDAVNLNEDMGTQSYFGVKSENSSGDVTGVELNIGANAVAKDVYAVVTKGANAVGNTINMNGGKLESVTGASTAYGANTNGAVTNNKVIINAGNVKDAVGGVVFGTGAITGNTVEINDGLIGTVHGANTWTAEASGNKVVINGGQVSGDGFTGITPYGGTYGVYGASAMTNNADISVKLGTLKNNIVEVKQDAIVSNVIGAYSNGNADLIANRVNISGNAKIMNNNGVSNSGDGQVYGAWSELGDIKDNIVDISGNVVIGNKDGQYPDGRVYGGYGMGGSVTGNTVKILGNVRVETNIYDGAVYGGYSESGLIENNAVDIGGNFTTIGDITGGDSSGIVRNNTVKLGGYIDVGNVYGGVTYTGGASNNSVVINSGKINGTYASMNSYETGTHGVYGAIAKYDDEEVQLGTLQNNNVEINNDTVVSNVFGAYSDYNSDVIGNKVTLTGNVKVMDNTTSGMGQVYGAWSELGDIKDNVVTISDNVEIGNQDSTPDGRVYGGYGTSGIISGNKVNISGNVKINTNIYDGAVCGGYSESGLTENNAVEINGALTTIGNITGGNSNGLVKNNSVVINGDASVGNVYGGVTYTGGAEGNRVVVNGGRVNGSGTDKLGSNGIYGAAAFFDAPNEKLGALRNNIVEVNNTVAVNNIFGAYSDGDADVSGNVVVINGNVGKTTIYGGYSESGDVVNNIVEIGADAVIDGKVYGGYGHGKVEGNKIIIKGKVIGDIYGSLKENAQVFRRFNLRSAAVPLANVIEIHKGADLAQANIIGSDANGADNKVVIGSGKGDDSWSGNVKSISNVSEIKFSNVNLDNGGVILKVTDPEGLNGTKIDLNNINFDVQSGTVDKKQKVQFITDGNAKSLENIEYVPAANGSSYEYSQGTAINGTFTLDTEGGNADIETQVVASQTDLVMENRAVAAAFVGQGSDIVLDGISSLTDNEEYGDKTFAALVGGSSKYDVNDDLKVDGFAGLLGLGNTKNISGNDLSWGVFYEHGDGDYDTNNNGLRGSGDLKYDGGGLVVNYKKANGMYTEGSVRIGSVKNDVENILQEANGSIYGYETDSEYYGMHVGLGKVITLNENTDVDIYGKFFHTYTDGDDVTLANTEKYSFDSVTSDRLRVGARVSTNKLNKWQAYYGLAYEYEFDGKANAMVQNIALAEKSTKGSTYIAELGMLYVPTVTSPIGFDFNMKGFAGERKGFTARLQAVYLF